MPISNIYSLKNVIIKTTDSYGTSEEAIKLKTKIEKWKTVKVVIGTSDELIKFIILLTKESNLKNNETNILSKDIEVMAFFDGKNKKNLNFRERNRTKNLNSRERNRKENNIIN